MAFMVPTSSSEPFADRTRRPFPSSASCRTLGQRTLAVFPLPVLPMTWRCVVRWRADR